MAVFITGFSTGFASAQSATIGDAVAAQSREANLERVYGRAFQRLDATSFEKPAGFQSLEHKFDGKLKSTEDLNAALAELMASVDGKLLDRKETEAWKARVESGYIGVGLSLDELQLVGSEGVLVTEVIAESTAEEAGLLDGDRIIEVNGKSFFAKTFEELTDAIQGPDGTFVTLTVSRGAASTKVEVKRDLDEKIGVKLSLDKPHSLFKVRWVNRGGPAALAGLKEDDIITGIAGKPAENLDMVEALTMLRTEYLDTPVSISVRRGEDQNLDLNFDSGIVPDWSLSMSYEGQGGGYPNDLRYNRFIMGVKNLDYAAFMDDFHEDFISEFPGGIMDFRGASGEDVELAVKFIAAFHGGTAELLRIKERVDGKEVVTVYARNADGDIERRRGTEVDVVFSGLKPLEYDGKLVIIVDSQTSGTAEAVVHALKSLGRASVVGWSTAGRSQLSTHYNLSDVSAISYDSGRLLMSDGSPMTAVSVDRTVVVSDNAMDTALNQLSGKSRINDSEMIIFIGILTVICLFGAVLFLGPNKNSPKRNLTGDDTGGGGGRRGGRGRRCGANDEQCTLTLDDEGEEANTATVADAAPEAGSPEATDAADAAPEAVSPEATDAADAADAADAIDNAPALEQAPGEDVDCCDPEEEKGAAPPTDVGSGRAKPKPRSASRFLWLLPLAFIGLVFIGVPLLTKQMDAPPTGATSKVTVEFFTDGSQETMSQKAVIDQLAAEYSGAIEFRTIDIVKDPAAAHPQASTGEVKNVPTVIVTKQWFDAKGKQISMHSSWSRKVPKRELVPMIERAAKSNRDGWPDTPIQRTRITSP